MSILGREPYPYRDQFIDKIIDHLFETYIDEISMAYQEGNRNADNPDSDLSTEKWADKFYDELIQTMEELPSYLRANKDVLFPVFLSEYQ